MKHTWLTTLFAFLSLFIIVSSCNNNDEPAPIPEIIQPTIFKYVYTGKHEIKDFNVYVGPRGEKLEKDTTFASNFWGEHSLLGEPYKDIIIIDTKKDSLYMRDSKFPDLGFNLLLELSNDTLKSGNYEYWGVFKNDSIFIMNRAHYFIHYDGREEGWSQYPHIGHYGYWCYHEKARMNAFFHENSRFGSFADMNLPTDTIAWLTEYYEFKLTEKK